MIYYRNSSLTFHEVKKKIFDVRLDPCNKPGVEVHNCNPNSGS